MNILKLCNHWCSNTSQNWICSNTTVNVTFFRHLQTLYSSCYNYSGRLSVTTQDLWNIFSQNMMLESVKMKLSCHFTFHSDYTVSMIDWHALDHSFNDKSTRISFFISSTICNIFIRDKKLSNWSCRTKWNTIYFQCVFMYVMSTFNAIN
jgi:hypothetical protein